VGSSDLSIGPDPLTPNPLPNWERERAVLVAMLCSNLLVPAMILAAPVAGWRSGADMQWPRYYLGAPLSQEEIRSFDVMIGPGGKELPPGRGAAKEGAVTYAKR
jgi:hypothetical protein